MSQLPLNPKIKNYRPDIDGLRAVAILSVVGFHVFPGLLHGGFIGVDIFFVISGFLISKIIFSALEGDRFSITEFYIRRIRRIFPALIAVLIATLFIGWYMLIGNEYRQLGKHIAAGAGYVSNFLLWNESGYFDHAAATKPLLHLWSLAIEEQFYIIWPVMLVFVWKRQWNFLKITVFIALASFAINIYFINTNAVSAFYMPQARFWELMIGGILAYISLHCPQLNSQFKNGRSVLGFAFLAAGLLFSSKYRAFPGWLALLPTVGTYLIISAGSDAWLNRNVLSNRVMVWFGLISYPLYLWHWPLLSFSRIVDYGSPPFKTKVAVALSAILLAWLTYKFVEEPFRFGVRLKLRVNILLISLVSLLGTGLLISHGDILPRNTSSKLDRIVSAFDDWDYPGKLKPFGSKSPGTYFVASDKTDKTIFIGDSHVQQYGPRVFNVVRKNQKTANTALFMSDGACPPIPNVFYDAHPGYKACDDVRNYGYDFAERPDVNTVVVGACWNCYFLDELNKKTRGNYYILVNGKRKYFRGGDGVKVALNKLQDLLKKLSESKRVFLLLDNPEGDEFSPQAFIEGNRMGSLKIDSTKKTININSNQLDLRKRLIELAKNAGVGIIDPFPTMCDQGEHCVRMTDDGKPIYMDHNHMRPFFVRQSANYIDAALFLDATGLEQVSIAKNGKK
jgi:peptidoglycan/LPS O-acetylase OafA/YrhL